MEIKEIKSCAYVFKQLGSRASPNEKALAGTVTHSAISNYKPFSQKQLCNILCRFPLFFDAKRLLYHAFIEQMRSGKSLASDPKQAPPYPL